MRAGDDGREWALSADRAEVGHPMQVTPSALTDVDFLLRATRRATIDDALTWIGDDHTLERDTDLHRLLRAVVSSGKGRPEQTRALRQLARVVAASELDSAAVLFGADGIVPASHFRNTLAELASVCPTKTLAGITAGAVLAAQRSDPFTIEALCAVAGLSYKELTERVAELPANAAGPFGPSQVRRAFQAIDAVVRGATATDWPGAVAARPVELMPRVGLGRDGWDAVEALRVGGVPYDVLLAQRAAGGSWLAHRNRTSAKLGLLLADRLCQELRARGLDFRRSNSVGGEVMSSAICKLTGCDRQLGLVVLHPKLDVPAFGVIFSSARDGGTASKNAGRLRTMKRAPGLRIAVVVAGPGWAARNETADLALAFGGYLYSERSISELANDILDVMHDATWGNPNDDDRRS